MSVPAQRGAASEAARREEARLAETPPPFLGSWRNVYLLLAAELAVSVLLFHWLTRWAS